MYQIIIKIHSTAYPQQTIKEIFNIAKTIESKVGQIQNSTANEYQQGYFMQGYMSETDNSADLQAALSEYTDIEIIANEVNNDI